MGAEAKLPEVIDILVDTSESMGSLWSGEEADGSQKTRMEIVRESLVDVIAKEVSDDRIVGLRLFGGLGGVGRVESIIPLCKGARADFMAKAGKIPNPEGLTPLFQAVRESVRDIGKFPGQKRIIILTDGDETQVCAHLPEDQRVAFVEAERAKLKAELIEAKLHLGDRKDLRIDIIGIGNFSEDTKVAVGDIADVVTIIPDPATEATEGLPKDQSDTQVKAALDAAIRGSAGLPTPSLAPILSQPENSSRPIQNATALSQPSGNLFWMLLAMQLFTIMGIFGLYFLKPSTADNLDALKQEVLSTNQRLEKQAKQFSNMIDILLKESRPR